MSCVCPGAWPWATRLNASSQSQKPSLVSRIKAGRGVAITNQRTDTNHHTNCGVGEELRGPQAAALTPFPLPSPSAPLQAAPSPPPAPSKLTQRLAFWSSWTASSALPTYPLPHPSHPSPPYTPLPTKAPLACASGPSEALDTLILWQSLLAPSQLLKQAVRLLVAGWCGKTRGGDGVVVAWDGLVFGGRSEVGCAGRA